MKTEHTLNNGHAYVDKEYSQVRVPNKGRERLIRPTAVWFGYAFGPVALNSAAYVAGAFKFSTMILITLLGCGMLIFISGLMGWIGQREGMTFALISRFAWGSKAYRIATMIIPIGLIGWSSIHIFTVGMFVNRMITNTSDINAVYIITCIITVCCIGGSAVKGIHTVTNIGFFAVPYILVLLFIAASKAMGDLGSWSNVFNMDPGALGTITLATGVTAMVGSFACGAGGASADIQRFCKKPSGAWVVSLVTFGIAYPFLMVVSSLISLATGATTFVDAFASFHMLPAGSIVVFLLAWSTVNADYYTSSLSFAAALGVRREVATIVIACVGGILACLGSGFFLEKYLTYMTAFMVPIVGVAASDYFLVNKGHYPEPYIATGKDSKIPPVKWGAVIAYAVGVATLMITEHFAFLVPPVNCLVVTALVHFIACKLLPQKSNFNDLIDKDARDESFNAPSFEELKAQGLVK